MELTLQAMKTLSELMDQALDLDSETRTRWVASLSTGPHAALQPFLADMLAKQADMETAFMVKPITLPDAPPAAGLAHAAMNALAASTRVGPYVLQREVGQGGMGAVWLANRVDGAMTRQVALKLPTIHLTDALAERFSRERDILAQLTHPNIARLYDAGVSDAGRPYLALEYVEGKPITEHCDAINLPINERLRRFLQVASAVQYAHANLVIHRDLKPSNILVSDDGQVHLLDFGIAKLLDDPKAQMADTELTMLAGRALTLDYASPEQVNGQAISIGSDVYSMGVVLYQLLTGYKPYQLKRGSRAELEEAIVSGDALPPSDAVRRGDDASAAHRALGKDRLARALAGDLDTIVAKAMKKKPAHRYATVAALAADIQRHLDGLPVEAQPDSWRYRMGKFVARNRVGVAASTAMVVALGGGAAVAMWQANVASSEASRADREANVARSEKLRADSEALISKRQSQRADNEAGAARNSAELAQAQALLANQSAALAKTAAARAASAAALADQQSQIARQQAVRADLESNIAKGAVIRAEASAEASVRDAARAKAVQAFIVDIFSANSNDQRNAVELRKLNARQLLDRGVAKLSTARDTSSEIHADLYKLFGTLYADLQEFEAAKKMHALSVSFAERAYGKESKQYALARMEQANAESRLENGRPEWYEEARQILTRVAPDGIEMATLLLRYSEGLKNKSPDKALQYATQASAMMDDLNAPAQLRGRAAEALAVMYRRMGEHEKALPIYQHASAFHAQATGKDSFDYGESLIGVVASLQEMLRVREAYAVAVEMNNVLRPLRGNELDASPQGLRLAELIEDLGDFDRAEAMLNAAYSKLQDVDGKAHPFKSSVSKDLAESARRRDDPKKALALALRARAELGEKSAGFVANSLATVAGAAFEAGEISMAESAVREARALEKSHGMSANLRVVFEQIEHTIAASRGQFKDASPTIQTPLGDRAPDTWSPKQRLRFSINRASSAARQAQWNEVLKYVEPWLKKDSPYELPLHQNATLLVLAARAEVAQKTPNAAMAIDRAEVNLLKFVVPSSARLALVRALRASL